MSRVRIPGPHGMSNLTTGKTEELVGIGLQLTCQLLEREGRPQGEGAEPGEEEAESKCGWRRGEAGVLSAPPRLRRPAERSPVLGSSGDRLEPGCSAWGGWARVGLHQRGLPSCCSFTRLLWDHLPASTAKSSHLL